MTEELRPVRPLDIAEERPQHSPPNLVLVVLLLGVGALIGWIIASLGGDTVATAAPTTRGDGTMSLADLEPVSSIIWQESASVPPIPDGMLYAGATDPVELDGSIYVAVRFSDGDTDEVSSQLWSSSDGLTWVAEDIDLGVQSEVVELTAIGNGLILSARTDEGFGLWRSPLGRAVDGASWSQLPLDLPDNVDIAFHHTAINNSGEISTVLIGSLEIWREIVAPYAPSDIDAFDPELVLFQGAVVRPGEDTPYQILGENPEVLTTRDTVWVRVVDRDGNEELFTRPLPEGAYPLESAPDLGAISVTFAWRSNNGVEFTPITGRGALPDGYFLPEAWRSGFIGAAYELEDAFAPTEEVRLWHSESGRAWQPFEHQPPRDCARYFFAASRDRLLLIDGSTRCLWTDGQWEVMTEPSDVLFLVGGPAGFLGYPESLDLTSATFSRDGRNWIDIEIPGAEPSPTLAILDKQLFVLSATGAEGPIEIWLGEIE